MNLSNFSKKQIISLSVVILLLAGVIIGLVLIQRQQILKSKATESEFDAFEVSSPNGILLPHTDNAGTRVYQTNDLNVNIKVKDINGLVGEP